MPPALCYPCGLWAYSHLPNRFAGPSKSGRRGRPLCLSGGSFHLGSESDVVACALRSLSVGTAEEREPATLRCPTATTTVRPPRRPPRRPSSAPGRRKQSSFIGEREEKRSLFLWQPTDGPPCSTAARNSRRRRAPLRGRSALDARSSLSPSPWLLSLLPFNSPWAAEMVPRKAGPPGCRNGQSRRRLRGSLGGKIECCCLVGLLDRAECLGGCAANFLHG